jgi:hypothetical protein
MSFPRFKIQETETPPATFATSGYFSCFFGLNPLKSSNSSESSRGAPQSAIFEQTPSPLASRRASILAAPAATAPGFDKLASVSLSFLDSGWAAKALAADWDEIALFAIHEGPAPKERIDA